ncbi:ArgP/LysG family DNA-binding transcriptional regulator [Corticibacter populi]|uniref:ArgP/LysG family DNA-binding transcriptional regulator n=1 Tax=Corticibacter populi TaxID=1550736 RepID=A0A3M6QRW5_9BURK|nr:HTH-type transcriptional regulator ArgP [Corticibacter populi]RMX05784.1 ArgP/LysG family DNA-binding transcriptional regulator [Corticibacter populi]RZS30910.1 LysR family transcriptional regulator [Corticibacter populi]
MFDARQTDAFLAVAQCGSFARAAQALAISLPAVSLRIRGLETALGRRLLVRGKQVVPTPAGQVLLAHLRQVQSMEADLQRHLQGGADGTGSWHSMAIAVNGDSLASWFLPGVEAALQRHRIVLDITLDDQDFTHAALKSGEVTGCISTLAQPLRGCCAVPLGAMRYHCVASRTLLERLRDPGTGRVSLGRLLAVPAIIFNRKDGLQDAFLQQQFGVVQPQYPRHFVPSTEAYESAIALGLGWGMVSRQQLQRRAGHQPALEEVIAEAGLDVLLYWHHWERESLTAQRLTLAIVAAARQHLRPLPWERASGL